MVENFARISVLAALLVSGAAAQEIPRRPEDIRFEPLQFEPPRAADYRHELTSGVPVYLAVSHEFPLVQISFSFRGGRSLDPEGRSGLVEMMASLVRRGGSAKLSAEELDERFDFLAANVGTGAGIADSTASLDCLVSSLDEAFELFLDMVRHPRFQESRRRLYLDEELESMKQRNDDAGDILSREWDWLMYGRGHVEGRVPTKASLEGIDEAALREAHARIFHPGNLIISVTGDFEEGAMLARLEQALEGWEAGPVSPDPASDSHEPTPGVYRAEKDIPQGKVILGHRSVTRDHPDYFPLLVMNEILGGGGFTSRITSRVRSDEGLAYSAGSRLGLDVYYPGTFTASFQSKNVTVALAVKIILEEIERMRTELVTDQELDTAKSNFVETFPRRFQSKRGMLNLFVQDERTARPAGYWESYRDHVTAVTAEDVRRAAKTHLDPEAMAILIVGKWEEIAAGNDRATMSELGGDHATELPIRDPLTLEPLRN